MSKFAPLFVLGCAVWYVWRAVVVPFPDAGPSDFQWYYLAAQHILHGRSPYLAAGYIYPPLTAFLFTPFAVFPYVPARRAWFLLSNVFMLTAASILWRRSGSNWKSACCVAFVWAFGGAADESIALGQVGPLLTLLITLACFPGRLRSQAISVSCAIKIFPGILGFTLLLRREWRNLLRTAILAVLLLALPWIALHFFFTGPQMPSGTGFLAGTSTILSWSLPSVVLRAFHPPGSDGKPPAIWTNDNLAGVHLSPHDRVLAVSVAALTLFAGLFVWIYATRLRLARSAVPYASAALISLILIAAPVCWTHYQVLQYPGAALLLARTAQDSHWPRFFATLISWLFLYTVPVAVLRAGYAAHHGWPAHPAYLYFWTSVSAAAGIALFTLATHEGTSTSPGGSPVSGRTVDAAGKR